jgi:ribosomal protein S18 acetylase RimI-like enzyme
MIEYRISSENDIHSCTKILIEGFHHQLKIIFGVSIPFQLLSDILLSCIKLENDGFMVAEENGKVLGFIIVSEDMMRLMLDFVKSFFGKLLWKFFMGKYKSVSFKSISFSLIQFFLFNIQSFHNNPFSRSYGQVVILAVDAESRGKGIGKMLLRKGMKHLEELGLKAVKLEVRKNNTIALNLYIKEGFVIKGKVKSAIGFSLILVKEFQSPAGFF